MVNLFIDSARAERKRYAPPPLRGVYVEEYAPGMGVIELDNGNRIDVPIEPGLYAAGAEVIVDRDATGRAIRAHQPHSIPPDAQIQPVGALGETLISTRAQATQAWEKTRETLAAQKVINDAVGEAKAENTRLSKALESVTADIDRLNDSLANGNTQVFVGATAPDGGKTGDLWVNNGTLKVYSGSEWVLAIDDTALRAEIAAVSGALEDVKTAPVPLDQLTSGEMTSPVAWTVFNAVKTQLVATQNIITENMVATGAITAKHITASEELAAKIGRFLKIATSQLILGKHVRWTDDSLTFYQVPPGNPTDAQLARWEERTPAIRLSPDGDSYISLADAAGGVAASMNADGLITARNVTVSGTVDADGLNIAGVPVFDYIMGSQERLAGYSSLPPLTHPAGTQNITMAEVEMALIPGLYRVSWNAEMTNSTGTADDAGGVIVQMRKRVSGQWQNMSFEHNRSQIEGWVTGGRYWNVNAEGYFRIAEPVSVKFLLNVHSYKKQQVSVNPSFFGVWLLPESMERKYTLISHSSPTPPPPPAKTQYVKTYSSTGFATFNEWGTRLTGWYADRACVGANPYYAEQGATKCMFFFPSWAGDLSGATVKKIEIGYTIRHTYFGAGSDFILGYHSQASAGAWQKFGGDFAPQHAVAGQTIWVNSPIGNASFLQNGSIRGVVFTAPNRDYRYNGQITSVQIRITYEK